MNGDYYGIFMYLYACFDGFLMVFCDAGLVFGCWSLKDKRQALEMGIASAQWKGHYSWKLSIAMAWRAIRSDLKIWDRAPHGHLHGGVVWALNFDPEPYRSGMDWFI